MMPGRNFRPEEKQKKDGKRKKSCEIMETSATGFLLSTVARTGCQARTSHIDTDTNCVSTPKPHVHNLE